MRMPRSFYNTHEVSALEAFILTVLSIVAPFFIVFALYTFAAVTIIDTYRHLNHARNAAAFHGQRHAARVCFAFVLPCVQSNVVAHAPWRETTSARAVVVAQRGGCKQVFRP